MHVDIDYTGQALGAQRQGEEGKGNETHQRQCTLDSYMGPARVFLLATLLFVFRTWAQTPGSGGIRGQVLDQSGSTVAGAAVELTNTDTGLRRRTVSGDGGYYAFP